jgi:hypothetical protein
VKGVLLVLLWKETFLRDIGRCKPSRGKECAMLQCKKTEDKESSKVNQKSYLISRETQTTTSKAKYTSTSCESGTQTETFGKGCEICLLANPYTSSTNVLQLKHSKARVLQQFWRGAVSRRSFVRLRRDFQRSTSVSFLSINYFYHL